MPADADAAVELGFLAAGMSQRLGQFLANIMQLHGGVESLFYMSDEELLEAAREYVKTYGGRPTL